MIYLEALSAAIWADDPDAIRAAAEEARRLPPGTEPQDLLLDGLAVRLTDGAVAGAPPLRAALEAVLALEPAPGRLGEWLWLTGLRGAGTVALELADADAAHTLASRQVQVAREHGALVQLQFALNFVARTHILRGELAAAEVALDEERRIATATRRPPIGYTAMGLAAWRGQEGPATEVIASASGRGRVANIADHAAAVLWNGLGRYDLARDAAQRAFARDQLTYRLLIAPDLAEAASRTGDTALLGAAARGAGRPRRRRPTGCSACARGCARSPVSGTRPSATTANRSTGSSGRHCAASSPARACCTGSGCDERAAGSTPASSCASPARR